MSRSGQGNVGHVSHVVVRNPGHSRLPGRLTNSTLCAAGLDISRTGPAASRPRTVAKAALVPHIFRNVGNSRLLHGGFASPVFARQSVLIKHGSADGHSEGCRRKQVDGDGIGRRWRRGVVAAFRTIVSGGYK